MVDFLSGEHAAGMTHAELEERLHTDGMRLLCQLLQDSLDLRASREERLDEVTDADSHLRGWAERGRQRTLATRFGEVVVTRIAYRARARADLNPADAVLNLPVEKHSHGLRRLAAAEAARGSFTDAAAAIERATTVRIGKRQVEALAAAAAIDVDAFYTAHAPDWSADDDVLALSFDAKGVVMRPDGLRAGTAKAAVSQKLAGRRSKGEKRNRKRMCEVAAVFDVTGKPRTIADILPEDPEAAQTATPAPVTSGKWLHASVTDDAAAVIAAGFAEADRRDPDHARTWIALVDGNTHQIDRIHAEAKTRKITLPVVVDFIHVIEYLWKATWCFHPEGDPNAERWVRAQARQVLAGRAGIVAAAIRRKATYHGLDPGKRKPADVAAAYLLAKKPYLDYPTALANGWPIATGVIEGACRHLVKDRMDVTGARWGLDGAEAILKLRTLISNGDFDQYWTWHLAQEQQRIHNSRYLGGAIPQ
ncbi:ISKra4 family transposase [Micromonospora sp. WMMA1363]|uniref:ISKra4 family transposase n=1 Tax=Micromonospora sp. WMMA1363 TaxID=3053985 RepID=UPI00259D0B75|nr:ISKra4 family transposase [Micromonospora sp. WMMA1363]MDM4718775.1 ISKra4 family transposase [Micromonospora sp. WMMA1363]MDM4719569.1 ISKra4 family transposase [Micromonospora sp. WMMA1363]MDM4721169.1 ISKra4 family transposase [Micromonospora sp. WMMA1363]MDM4721370.1 ISKra4 family transposase [Micromonospora sp. WMMA1363]MDM4721393.1 ISKra4 family transposase [Micromonospora sp. WMMA1363]